ncbi:hypothetical protein IJ843_03320 [bacterium]|nr:hypothetical protein [bacterium]
MFKCKECGQEYDLKPEYCDCVNDTFEEITPIVPTTPQPEEQPKNAEKTVEKPVVIKEEPVKQQIQTPKQTSASTVKPYAIATFVICLILSLLIILFAFNPKPALEEQQTETKVETSTQNIPSIEKLWNSSTEGISSYQTKNETKTNSEQQNTAKKKVEVTQPVKQETKQALNPVKTTSRPATITSKTKTAPLKNNSSNSVSTTSTKTQTKTQTEVKVNPQELENYKIKLRNYIASKISFASVVGDGTCTFSFKVSNTGVLTNKAPAALSDNDSLNEAVYNALRQIYSYSAPPSGYKNDTLKLKVNMYNNSFEVYLN